MAFSQINSFSSSFLHNNPTTTTYDDISSTSLTYWYKFNSGDINSSNKVYNYADSTYDATAISGASIDTSTYKTGSGSLYVNGGSYVAIDTFTSSLTGITIACWFKITTSSWARLFDFGNNSSSNNILFAMNGIPSVYRGTVENQPGSIGTYANGNWYHIVWTLSAVASSSVANCTWRIYINGSQIYTDTNYYPNAVSRTRNYIGKSNWSGDPSTSGYIDDFRYYTRAISASEALQLYNHTK